MNCIFCKSDEPKASKNAAYVICWRCVTRLTLMKPEQKSEEYDAYVKAGLDDKARALKENFVIGKAKAEVVWTDAIRMRGIRTVSRLVGVSDTTVRKWLKNSEIPRRYMDNVKKACSSAGVG